MKSRMIKIAGAMALGLIAHTSLADCVADISAAEARKAYQEATRLEAAGNLWDALLKYDIAQGYVCDNGGNPIASQSLDKAMTLGRQQGALEEKKGNFYKDRKPVGAFQWYEKGAQFSAADRVLVAALKKDPANRQMSAFAHEHFNERSQVYFATNNKSAIAASGDYQLDKNYETYVRSLPPTNIERLLNSYHTLLPDAYLHAFAQLEQQKDALQPGDIDGMINIQQAATQLQQQWQTDRLKDIKNAFDEAHRWTQQIHDDKAADIQRAQIDQARLAHADRIAKRYASTARLADSAMQFYRQQNKNEQIKAMEHKARIYAEQAMAAKKYQRARDFYSLIGDDENEQQARVQMEAQQAQLANNAQMSSAAQIADMQKMYSDPKKIQNLLKQAQEMQKQLEEQRKKGASVKEQQETAALEDELGL
jgi:hypothetical protein